jgi:hypothetical protein
MNQSAAPQAISITATPVTNERKQQEEQYLAGLTSIERQAYEIAVDHLGSSFSLRKSVGFVAWLAKNFPKNSAKK